MALQIQLRRGTASEWSSANPVLAEGELGVEKDTGKFKLGNGSSQWNSLLYSSGIPGVVTATSPATYDAPTQTVGVDQTAITLAQSQVTGLQARLDAAEDVLDVGEASISRMSPIGNIAQTFASETINLVYRRAVKTETISKITAYTATTAAGATPTVCLMGVYSVASNGDLTLVGETANDTTLFASSFTRYERNLTAAYTKQAGQLYAFALLIVTTETTPSFQGYTDQNATQVAQIRGISPRFSGDLPNQTALVSSISNASIASTSRRMVFMEVLP
jgi:hypothetical protein